MLAVIVTMTLMKKILTCLLLLCVSFSWAQRTDSIHVAHYDLQLSIMDFANQTIEGLAELQVVAKKSALPYVDLDLRALAVDSVWVDGQPAAFVRQGERLRVVLRSDCHAGDTLLVRVAYHGQPAQDSQWGGFYFAGEYAYNMGVGMKDIPHNFGRVWFPCLDVFTDKSTYTFHVRAPHGKRAVCGGMLTDSTELADQSVVWTWQLTDPIPTYLASVAVGPYDVWRDTIQGLERIIPIEIYTHPSVTAKRDGSFANLKKMIHAYERLFGPYRWQRVGYVTVDFDYGAMEHATSIAYPVRTVDGTEAAQSLWSHELSHAWFGNLITCQKAEAMWLNEGFAAFCGDLLTVECLKGKEAYESAFQALHHDVLLNLEKSDGDYFALNQVPQTCTYGKTSYDKGAIVVYTLRNLLGDSLFFAGLRSLFDRYAFGNVTSEQLISHLEEVTDVSLQDFYEGWINQPGFLHFSIDSIRYDKMARNYRVFVRQQLCHAEQLAQQQKVDITFFANGKAPYTVEGCVVSGERTVLHLSLPFNPVYGVVDYHNKMADAVIDNNFTITATGNYSYSLADFQVQITEAADNDTLRLRVENHLVAPDTIKRVDNDIYRISNQHYWRVEYVPGIGFKGQLKFHFAFILPSQPEYELMQGFNKNQLVLLYRRDPSDDWRIIPFTRSSSSYVGYLSTQWLIPGEYTLGAGNAALSVFDKETGQINVFPNPVEDRLEIVLPEAMQAELMDFSGKLLSKKNLQTGNNEMSMAQYSAGAYLLRLSSPQKVHTVKVVKE